MSTAWAGRINANANCTEDVQKLMPPAQAGRTKAEPTAQRQDV